MRLEIEFVDITMERISYDCGNGKSHES